jgi:hypothetical protein
MNMEQIDHEKSQETETMAEPKKKSETVLLQMKETPNEHRYTNLLEILKEKEQREVRI